MRSHLTDRLAQTGHRNSEVDATDLRRFVTCVLSGKFAVLIRDGFSSTLRRATQEGRESFEVAQQTVGDSVCVSFLSAVQGRGRAYHGNAVSKVNKAVGEKTPEVAA